jgi:hypothetical protein
MIVAFTLATIFGVNLVTARDAQRSFSARLEATDGASTWGRVKLIDSGDQSRVVVAIHGDVTGQFVAHMHKGTCGEYSGEPAFPLAVFDSSDRSRTTVAASVDALIRDGYLVDIHPLSDEASEILDPATAIVCGSLANARPDEAVGGGSDIQSPNTGIGPIDTQYSGTMLVPILAAVAVALAATRVVLTRKPKPEIAIYHPHEQMGRY